ncbi:porphobilinogen deaminase, dipyromethane cofactor binding domain-containing protein [Rhodotorula diobovata]|uniref:hydroxymethylbilane synthase n=1 Tax=Rhodotorula diobovata TaxID=5288 RepID=A0A5C5G2I7_9BASI|nr:porphobilinogen deaminase, dipyromethane cofactor binding domain-containing protein [Rhodotorula diobovata]
MLISLQTTLGDNVQTQPLYTFGGKALWTKELEVALLNHQVDAIVHSLKDVPTEFPPGCELGAVLEREDPSDALVVKEGLPYTSLAEMPEGSVIGTSSVRRVAQLRRKFPGLKFADVRGNLGTRLKKLDDPASSYTALILASAGLIRLNLGHRITAPVTSPALYHAVGQGAIGIEIREGDTRAAEIMGSLECWKTSWRTRAERMMLHVLEGGCSVPVGCETTLTEVDTPVTHHATLTLTGTITSLSGTHAVMCTLSRRCHSRDDAEQLGADVARELVEGGGREILTELGRHVKEVGGGDEAHDGREIPVEAPGAVNGAGGGAPVAPVAPVAIPIAQGDATAGGAVALSPSSASKSPAKSPHSQRTVFRGEGDKCLRPAGW